MLKTHCKWGKKHGLTFSDGNKDSRATRVREIIQRLRISAISIDHLEKWSHFWYWTLNKISVTGLSLLLAFSWVLPIKVISRLGRAGRIGTRRVYVPSFPSLSGHHPQWLLSSGYGCFWAFSLPGYSVHHNPVKGPFLIQVINNKI